MIYELYLGVSGQCSHVKDVF